MNKASVYEIKADNIGYFKVPPKSIPIFPYYLEILPPSGGVITYSTSEFAKENKKYLDNNKINLLAGTKDNKSLISGIPTSTSSSITNTNNQNVNQQKTEASKNKSKISSMLFLVLIIFVFLILIGLTVFFIIKNKNNPPPSPQNF